MRARTAAWGTLVGGSLAVGVIVAAREENLAQFARATSTQASTPLSAAAPRPCPPEMVHTGGASCIDRWEARLADPSTGELLSPHYHGDAELRARDHKAWQVRRERTGPYRARQVPLPQLSPGEVLGPVMAVSRPGILPSAYVDAFMARRACQAAGKRLCLPAEWLAACRGRARTRHPYGASFSPGACNIARPFHPAATLHSPGELGGTDPRLNLVTHRGRPLLMPTGSSPECLSRFGDDGAFDMVGNLDEWVDDPKGVFLGGFYARDTPWGCDARVEIHSPDYYDYSLGFRCCRDALRQEGETDLRPRK